MPGEPDPETVETYQEHKEAERERIKRLPGEAKVYFMNDCILARAAREGRGFTPSG